LELLEDRVGDSGGDEAELGRGVDVFAVARDMRGAVGDTIFTDTLDDTAGGVDTTPLEEVVVVLDWLW